MTVHRKQKFNLKILSPKQKHVFDLLDDDPIVTEILFGGAAGGGKTVCICLWQILRRLKHPGTRGCIGRYSFTDLQNTTIKTFEEQYARIAHYVPWKYHMRIVGNTAKFSNGSEIIFRWLNNKSASRGNDPNLGLGSLDLTDACIDEVTEVPNKVKRMLSSRIRWKLINDKPALLMACNPANNWVKLEYVMDMQGNPVTLPPHKRFIQAKVDDNPDAAFVKAYKTQLGKLLPNDMMRLLHGKWNIIDNDNPWFHQFEDSCLFDGIEVDEFEPILLSFDFNVSPCTCTVGQYIEGVGLNIIRSHEVEGGTTKLMYEIENYQYHNHPGGIQVTGDVSGNARHSSSGINSFGELNTDYGIIKEALDLSNRDIVHTYKQNPRLKYSRRIVNHAFQRKLIRINRYECGALIGDLSTAQPDINDKIIKGAEIGMGFHHADNFRYLVHMVFKNGYKDINIASDLLGVEEHSNGEQNGVDTFVPEPGNDLRADSINSLYKNR